MRASKHCIYELGDIVTCPLDDTRSLWGIGVISAWSELPTRRNKTLLWYGMKQTWSREPVSIDGQELKPTDAITLVLSGDRGVSDRHWKVVAKIPDYSIRPWPLPVFRTTMRGEISEYTKLEINIPSVGASGLVDVESLCSRSELSLFPPSVGLGSSDALPSAIALAIARHPLRYFSVTHEAIALWEEIHKKVKHSGKYSEIEKDGWYYGGIDRTKTQK